MRVSGIVLAAGGSARLGRPKQLLLLDGEPIIRIVVRHALASQLDDVLLVTGANHESVLAAVGELGQRTIRNPGFATGLSSSVRLGLSEFSTVSDAVIFLLGDQPEVGPEVIDLLIGVFRRMGAPIVQPLYGGIAANPVLFSRSLFHELAEVTGDQGARSVVKRHADGVTRVEISNQPPPGDVDTEADYQALVSRWEERKKTHHVT